MPYQPDTIDLRDINPIKVLQVACMLESLNSSLKHLTNRSILHRMDLMVQPVLLCHNSTQEYI